jgi:hypothetical protein
MEKASNTRKKSIGQAATAEQTPEKQAKKTSSRKFKGKVVRTLNLKGGKGRESNMTRRTVC